MHHTWRHSSETSIWYHSWCQVVGMRLLCSIHQSSFYVCTDFWGSRNWVLVECNVQSCSAYLCTMLWYTMQVEPGVGMGGQVIPHAYVGDSSFVFIPEGWYVVMMQSMGRNCFQWTMWVRSLQPSRPSNQTIPLL